MIRVSWQDVMWRPALEKANLFVEPLPRILLASPKAQAGRKRNVMRPKPGGFCYLIVHQNREDYYWSYKDRAACLLKDNQFPTDNQFISGVPLVYTKNKLKFPGTETVCRPQENSFLEVGY